MQYFIVAACNAKTYYLLYVFCESRRQQNRQKFGSRYLGEGSSEWDKILQVARVGLVYPTTQTGDIWPRGSSWGAKILKGVKNFCNTFLQGGFTDLDDMGMMGALGGSRS